jgi:hypothetical protein
MNTSEKHEAFTEEVEATSRFTNEQLMVLLDIVRFLRLLRAQRKALAPELTADTSYRTFPDPHAKRTEVDRNRLEQRVGLGDGA